MAARPQPLSALQLCNRLATTSVTRLGALIARTKDALKNNNLLTAAERAHYVAAIAAAESQRTAFGNVAKVKVPKAMPKGKKRGPGRPSKKDIAKGMAVKAAAKAA